MIAIYKKEIRAYFTQVTGYIFLTFMLAIIGLFYAFTNVFGMSPNFQSTLFESTILFFILIPTLTMRLFSEETRHKTDQLLFTSPVSVGQIVLGKFLAALSLFLIGIIITFILPTLLVLFAPFGAMPTSLIVGSYIGFVLIGASSIAVGLFISVLTDNQIVAAVGTFVAIFVLFIMDSLAMMVPTTAWTSFVFVAAVIIGTAALWYNSTKNIIAAAVVGILGLVIAIALYHFNNHIYDGVVVRVMLWFSITARYNSLVRGVLNTADIIYYLSFCVLFIYLTINVIEKRRWR